MTGIDLGGGRHFADWRELIETNLTTCTCQYVVVFIERDPTGTVAGAQYEHTDESCAAVVALVADAVEDITGDPGADGTERT